MYYDFKATHEAITHGHSKLIQEICELLETIGQMGKTYTMQWISAHVEIDANVADKLAKEAIDLSNNTTSLVTLDEAHAISHYGLKEKTIQVHQEIYETDVDREITKIITRLKIGQFRDMKINRTIPGHM